MNEVRRPPAGGRPMSVATGRLLDLRERVGDELLELEGEELAGRDVEPRDRASRVGVAAPVGVRARRVAVRVAVGVRTAGEVAVRLTRRLDPHEGEDVLVHAGRVGLRDL